MHARTRVSVLLIGMLVAAASAGALGGCGRASSPSPSAAQAPPAVRKSPDSGAPLTAPAHWLPPAAWVYNHWLPYDESRLYALLGIDRRRLWAQLRDDHRTLGELAATRGFRDPAALAAALVAPRRERVPARRLAELRRRAVLTITQGHLAQHLFFHSLHQFAIASAAPDIFGVTDVAFRALRRQELSPLAIGRLRGRSPGRVEGQAIAVLRERAEAGVRGGAMTGRQASLLLRRQLTQLPRWLDQARYNGPPPTHRGDLVAKPADYASNPALSADGRFVAYEAYRQKLPLAVRLGEIAVLRVDLRTGRSALISGIPGAGRAGPNPVSAYNPAVSGDGHWIAYESSAGNQNFAKRYGRIGTLLTDARARRTTSVGRPDRRVPDSQSSYDPYVSASGSRMIYEAVRGGRTVVRLRELGSGRERTVVAGLRAGGRRYRDPYEATLSADGGRIAYTLADGVLAGTGAARSTVRVTDADSGTVRIASRADGPRGRVADGFSADPAISPDGRFVAFTSSAAGLGVARGAVGLFLRDLSRGRTRRIPTGGARPLDPVLSRGGRVVAFTAVRGPAAQVRAWSAASGTSVVVSRATGPAGRPGDGFSGDPSISADGRRVAFASTASNMVAGGGAARAVYVRDLRSRRTTRVSDPAVAYGGRTLPPQPPKPPVPVAPTPTGAAPRSGARGEGEVTVWVTDNAFVAGGQRPTVRIRTGATVTWRWRSHESHQVLAHAGPARFASAMRNRGSFSARLKRPGTYRIVCALHAPGMRMTVIVGG